MLDDVWLAVSSDVVIFFDSLANHLQHFGRLRRVPLCAYLYFFASKGTTVTAKIIALLNRTAQERLRGK